MASESDKRFWIILTALNEVSAGSHYLKGADGAIPGVAGSGLVRELSMPEDLDIERLNVHAARNNLGVCRGRWEKVGGKQFVKGEYDRDVVLPQYLESLRSSYMAPEYWRSFQDSGRFPRRDAGYIFLGEDCRGKRHFDCEGFVAWVLVKALHKDKGTWRKGIGWYQNAENKHLDVYQHTGGGVYTHENGDTITQSEIRDGDILIRKPNSWGGEHIALACAKGKGVLEASGKDVGVVFSKYHANWTQLARIKSL